jgi:hypothetical protein
MRIRSVADARLVLLLLSAPVDIASAQVPARVQTPYTLMDAENRKNIEGAVETPLRGNGPFTGYGYSCTRGHTFSTRTSTCDWSSRQAASSRS